jgi:probable F420-dependent oxidoreductase
MNSRPAAARLGRFGVWSGEVRFSPPEASTALAQEVEALGWTAAWIPGGVDDRVLDDVDRLLSATKTMTLCTGILNIWKFEPERIAAWWAGQTAERQARVMLGLGVSHAPNIGEAYKQPVATMRRYVTSLLDAGVPRENLCLAALGPKMLELAAELTAGGHPYLVTPEHTAVARSHLGPDALLAPEQGVILETDPARAREIGRNAVANYLRLPNYLNSWRRLGFSEQDISTPSDRLIDALFAWGDVDAVRQRIQAHLDAGADHVCVQAVTGTMLGDVPRSRAIWREMAADLFA